MTGHWSGPRRRHDSLAVERRAYVAAAGRRQPVMRHFSSLYAALCVVVVVVVVAGCHGPDRHMRRKVEPSELVGTWKMTAASLRLLQRDGYVASPGETQTITFKADGSLAFASVLDQFEGGTLTTCNGTWRLDHDKTINNLRRANVVDVELQLTRNHTYLRTLSLAEEGGKLRLWDSYGDPDLWEFIEYERL